MALYWWIGIVGCLYVQVRGNDLGPPKITEVWDKVLYYQNNQKVELTCNARGSTPMKFEWRKNGILLKQSRNTQISGDRITIRKFKAEDAGVYQCFAVNDFGAAMSDEVVLTKATLELTDAKTESITTKIGEPLSLTCSIPTCVPLGPITWKMRNSTQQSVVQDTGRTTVDPEGTLHITHVIEDDRGSYLCEVQNEVIIASDMSSKYKLEIDDTEEEVTPDSELMWSSPDTVVAVIGDNVRLTCVFSGNPEPTVLWNKTTYGGSRKVATGQNLELVNVDQSDTGRYKCYIGDGSLKQIISLRVEVKPKWIRQLSAQKANPGSTVQFFCEASGYPMPTARWFLDGIPQQDSKIGFSRISMDETSLMIRNVQRSDNMMIQCNTSNTHGYLISEVSLSVVDGPILITTIPPIATSGWSGLSDRPSTVKPTTTQRTSTGPGSTDRNISDALPIDQDTLGIIIGGICAGLFVILILIILVICCQKRNKKRSKDAIKLNSTLYSQHYEQQSMNSNSRDGATTPTPYEDIGASYHSIYEELDDGEVYETMPGEYVQPENGFNNKTKLEIMDSVNGSYKEPTAFQTISGGRPSGHSYTQPDYSPDDDDRIIQGKSGVDQGYLDLETPTQPENNIHNQYLEPVNKSKALPNNYFTLEANTHFKDQNFPVNNNSNNNEDAPLSPHKYFVLEPMDYNAKNKDVLINHDDTPASPNKYYELDTNNI